jgi:hypothetical protein
VLGLILNSDPKDSDFIHISEHCWFYMIKYITPVTACDKEGLDTGKVYGSGLRV